VSDAAPRDARLVVVPLLLFLGVTGTVLVLAGLHLAKPSAPAVSSQPVVLGDAAAGKALFARTCAPCHGRDGAGGGIGPKLAGADVALAVAKATIDGGAGVMPAKLVAGKKESDVLAYLATVLAAKS